MRVGLTGGVGSGKSTVSRLLSELGALVVDADLIAREVVARGTPGLAAVAAELGRGVLTPEGDLDRAAVASLVFADDDARRRLEQIVHPLVYAEIARREAAAPPGTLVVHDIPLLTETARAGDFDAVVVVDVPEAEQVRRMVADRGWTEEEARSRMAAQTSRAQRLAIATHVLDNSGTLAQLRAAVQALYAELAPPGHG
jgi:dephospho-CoA kinase